MHLDLEDALEEAECHDLKCPITYSLFVQPVELHGKAGPRSRLCHCLHWLPQTACLWPLHGKALPALCARCSHQRQRPSPGLAAQVYERDAVLEWIRMRHTVPHSPADLAAPFHVQPCARMEHLLRQFAAEFGLQREVSLPEAPLVQRLPAVPQQLPHAGVQ